MRLDLFDSPPDCRCSGDLLLFAVPGRLENGGVVLVMLVEKERPKSVGWGAKGVFQIEGRIRGDDCARGVL